MQKSNPFLSDATEVYCLHIYNGSCRDYTSGDDPFFKALHAHCNVP